MEVTNLVGCEDDAPAVLDSEPHGALEGRRQLVVLRRRQRAFLRGAKPPQLIVFPLHVHFVWATES